MVDVDITHNDDSLVVRTVPFMVIVAEFLVLEVVNDRHKTYRQTHTILRTGVQLGQYTLEDTLCGGRTELPLLVDDTAFLVDFLSVEGQSVRPVLKDEDTGVDGTLSCCRYIAHAVYRLVDARVGIEVAAELHSQSTCVFEERRVREMLRAVEGHVLQEMGQTALVLVLLNGAHTLSNVEIGHMLRPLVVPDVVGQSVWQLAYAHILVDRYLSHVLCGGY